MQHYLYAVSSQDPAPGGDAASWLRHYKLEADDTQVFVPMVKNLEKIQPGDTLWFSIDKKLYGCVKVTRLEDDPSGVEIWFDGTAIKHVRDEIVTHLTSAVVDETWKRWQESLVP